MVLGDSYNASQWLPSLWESKNKSRNTSWRHIKVLWSETIGLCKKLNVIYSIITCNPKPQANGPEWCLVQTNHSFEPVLFSELDESVHQIRLNHLKQFVAQAAQIYKLLDQNSLLDAWQSLWLEMSQYTGITDPMMNKLIQCSSSSNSHWTEETVRLGPKTDEPLIWACVNRTLEWKGEMKVFNAFSWFMWKGELMNTSLFILYVLDMKNIHVSHHFWVQYIIAWLCKQTSELNQFIETNCPKESVQGK